MFETGSAHTGSHHCVAIRVPVGQPESESWEPHLLCELEQVSDSQSQHPTSERLVVLQE